MPANALEIRRLVGVVRRELSDAGISGLSADGSFEHAYVAALMAATILIRAHDERIHGPDHHRQTFVRLSELVGGQWASAQRTCSIAGCAENASVYDVAGSVSAAEAQELRVQADRLLREVREWLSQERPGLS